MALVNFVIATVGKCSEVAGLSLDSNFVIVHTVVKTLSAIVAFITNSPTSIIESSSQVGNLISFSTMYMAETTSSSAQGTVTSSGSVSSASEGSSESLKMVGYSSMHVSSRGKEHSCRGSGSVVEGCGIAVSSVVYFTNTVVNFALIGTQNVYSAAVGVWQTVSSPSQKASELTLTFFTFSYSSSAGTSALSWSPCKSLSDFIASLLHMFVSIFISNVYGLLLTVAIALMTTAYSNPRSSRQVAVHVLVHVNSFPASRRSHRSLWRLLSASWSTPLSLRHSMRRLQRRLRHLYSSERRFWQQSSHLGSSSGSVSRTALQRDSTNRAGGDGDPGEERRDPPDGRAGDGAHRESSGSPPSSSNGSLKASPSSGKDGKAPPAESSLSSSKEHEERKKCVICQDCTKTVVSSPCRHSCSCRDCTNISSRQPIYQQNCPSCRQMILNTMDVYS